MNCISSIRIKDILTNSVLVLVLDYIYGAFPPPFWRHAVFAVLNHIALFSMAVLVYTKNIFRNEISLEHMTFQW